MTFRRRLWLLVPIACASVMSSIALAGARTPVAIPAGTLVHHGAPVADGACQLGIIGSAGLLNDLFPPDDVYYVLLQPSFCTPCSLTTLANVRISLDFQTPCALPVSIGLTQSTGGSCPRPDPLHPLFALFDTTLASAETGVIEFVLPAPVTWKLRGDTFLSFNFTGVNDSCSTADIQPRLALTSGCNNCQAYESFAGSLDDVCAGTGGPLISADVGVCAYTPTRSRSWGAVKRLYR